jgi:hypothetical protein
MISSFVGCKEKTRERIGRDETRRQAMHGASPQSNETRNSCSLGTWTSEHPRTTLANGAAHKFDSGAVFCSADFWEA